MASVSVSWVAVAIIVSYVLGTVPGAPIVARRHGIDLFSTADGNPGAWNALEQLGWRRAWPAFAIDGAKGLFAAILGWAVLGWAPWDRPEAARLDSWLPWACVAAAMLGHAFPLPRPGRGGKSVMTFAGGAIGLVPVVGVPLLLAFVVGILLRRSGLAARVAVSSFPVLQAVATPLIQVGWTGALMTLIGLLFLVRGGDRRSH